MGCNKFCTEIALILGFIKIFHRFHWNQFIQEIEITMWDQSEIFLQEHPLMTFDFTIGRAIGVQNDTPKY